MSMNNLLRMRALGILLLLLATTEIVVLCFSYVGQIDLGYSFYENVVAVVDGFLLLILGVWCFRGGVTAWKFVMWYFMCMIVYSVIHEIVTTSSLFELDTLALSMLVIFYSVLIRLFATAAILDDIGLETMPKTINALSNFFLLSGLFLIISYLTSWLVGVFFLIVVLFVNRGRSMIKSTSKSPAL